MKKILLAVSVIVFTTVGYSQTGNSQNNSSINEPVQKITVNQVIVSNNSQSLVMINRNKIEKIQTTFAGEVVHQQDYQPAYPTPMFTPVPSLINEPKK